MNYPEILEACLFELRKIGKEREANIIKYSMNMHELKSCLREYVFLDDKKVNDFVEKAKSNLIAK